MTESNDERSHWAHTAQDERGALRTHSLREHLEGAAARAGEFAERLGAREWGSLAGRWHDLGKYSEAFQRYIRRSTSEREGRDAHVEDPPPDAPDDSPRTRVDHSTAGAALARRWSAAHKIGVRHPGTKLSPMEFVIAGHHAGLADAADLERRLDGRGDWCLAEVEAIAPEDITAASALAVPALPALRRDPSEKLSPQRRMDESMRRWEFWTRMLYSALCDADFLDTEAFFDASRESLRGGTATMGELAERLRAHLDGMESRARADGDREVLRVRRAVRAACEQRAGDPPGFFTLTVPTGGGKTLASMAFALDHARAHGLDRVVVAIPFTSITEQTADAYRASLSNREGVVVEHHSAFDDATLAAKRPGARRAELYRENAWNRLASENWDAPVVVTTTVQLFESLFSNRSSRCRKLHRLAKSVIVLDEAQTVPAGFLLPILDALRTLVRDYGATVVVCTATQPAWSPEVLGDDGIVGSREIFDQPQSFDALRRVRVEWPKTLQPTPYTAIAEELAERDDVLAIVHRRDDARALCLAVDAIANREDTVHLSALMCGEHRRAVLRSVRDRKARGEPVRVVSTQLVEAGVDIDFASVFRALAGIDALAQAAGRCNREGRLGREGGVLRVFLAETEPPPGSLSRASECTRTMLASAAAQGKTLDLFAPDTYREFFTRYYRAEGPGALDREGVQALRAEWRFRAVASAVRIIDDWAVPVVVPWGEAPSLVAELESMIASGRPPSGRLLRRLQGFSVNVRRDLADLWVRRGEARLVNDSVIVVQPLFRGAYSDRFGLDVESVGVVPLDDTVL